MFTKFTLRLFPDSKTSMEHTFSEEEKAAQKWRSLELEHDLYQIGVMALDFVIGTVVGLGVGAFLGVFGSMGKIRTLDMRVFSVEVGCEPPNQLTYITYVLRDVISVTT